jgi:hypothetical protein
MLDALFPEIFPTIASHLPLYVHPATLLALALTNRKIKDIILPCILYRHVHVKGEAHALHVISMLKADTIERTERDLLPRGHFTRRLFISSELSERAQASGVDTVRELRALIDFGGLRNLVSLGLHMGPGWFQDKEYHSIWESDRLDVSFWRSLKENCPELVEISLTGLKGGSESRWIENSGLYEFKVCSNLGRDAPAALISDHRTYGVFACRMDASSMMRSVSLHNFAIRSISFFLRRTCNVGLLRAL